MIIHKYKIEGKALCKAKTPIRGLWFVQDNDYKKVSINDELCQKCWKWSEELEKLGNDIFFMEAHTHLYTKKHTTELLTYKKPRFTQLMHENIPF